ncbi:MAG: hypothetical protein GVY08_04565 [Bacteroidetes bacterium]|nr:hypothetical protein [Bacteroidota bacterium]
MRPVISTLSYIALHDVWSVCILTSSKGWTRAFPAWMKKMRYATDHWQNVRANYG